MTVDILLGSMELQGTPLSVGIARKFLLETVGERHPALDDMMLLVSELVTNAVTHSDSSRKGGVVSLTIGELSGNRLHVVVTDDGSARSIPRPRAAEATDESGRGLALLQGLAKRWGTYSDGTRRAVWFQLAYREQATRSAAIPARAPLEAF